MESFIHTMLISYFNVLKKYAVFTGRAGRRDFWMFFLCNIIVCVILGILGLIPLLGVVIRIVLYVYSLAMLVPCLAVGVRRLHDTNKTGLLMLLSLTGIGSIVVLTLCAVEGTPGENQYGPNPIEEAAL